MSQHSGKVSPSTVLHTRNGVLKMNRPGNTPKNSILIYTTEDGLTKIDTTFDGDTVWLSIDQMADLFQRDRSVIGKHIRNIFKEGELQKESVWAKFAYTAADGKHTMWITIILMLSFPLVTASNPNEAHNSVSGQLAF